jgi:hypothetical protein
LPRKRSAAQGDERRPKAGSRGRKPALSSTRRAGGCADPQARALLLPYVLSRTEEAESVFFEAHLLACEACFRDLKLLDRVGSLIQELMTLAEPAKRTRRS